MSLFHYLLRPIAQIQPWGAPDHPTLSWFGLTDGWYWIELAGQALFRGREPAQPGELPYVGYQVVRLWEDLIEIVPSVLAPIPDDLARVMRAPERFLAEIDRLEATLDDQLRWDGLAFWHARCLSSAHLVAAPRLWLWRDGETIRALWRSPPGGAELWHPASGELALPVNEFLDELRAFDRALLRDMDERVQQLLRTSGLPGIEIDLEHLVREQRDRATWMEAAIAHPRADDWAVPRRVLAPP